MRVSGINNFLSPVSVRDNFADQTVDPNSAASILAAQVRALDEVKPMEITDELDLSDGVAIPPVKAVATEVPEHDVNKKPRRVGSLLDVTV